MSTKIITLDDRFTTGEPTVQLVVTPGRDGRALRETTSLHKIASSRSPALDYIESVEPEPGKSIVLVIGLGDSETYGANRNGDAFPSEPVPGKIAADEVLTKHYQTYDNAHVFEHHVNNDPAKAIGRVKKAFWNPHMRRVEVLEDFDHKKAPHLLEKIAAGQYPSKSMGSRIKYDVCTVCGNRARTRKEYCDHLKYSMNRVLPDGVKVAALNPSPIFFDSSWVIRPADRTGYMLQKVAYTSPYEIRSPSYELGERVEDLQNKRAALSKAADIDKVVSGTPEAVSSGFDDGSMKLIRRYTDTAAPGEASRLPQLNHKGMEITLKYSPRDAVGTMDELGAPMGIKDLIQYFLGRMMGQDDTTDSKELDSAVKHAGFALEVFAKYPRFFEDVLKTADLHEGVAFNEKLANEIWPQNYNQLDRNLEDSPLYDRRIPSSLTTAQTPATDVVTWTDPEMRTHVTNMGMAQRATDALKDEAQAGKAARGAGYMGLGTLLSAGGLGALMSKGRSPAKLLGGGAALGAGVVSGLHGAKEAVRPVRLSDLNAPMLLSNEGQLIPATTEMAYRRKQASWQPELLVTTLCVADRAASALSTPQKQALWAKIARCEVADDLSPYLGPTLDLAKVALLLEESILATR